MFCRDDFLIVHDTSYIHKKKFTQRYSYNEQLRGLIRGHLVQFHSKTNVRLKLQNFMDIQKIFYVVIAELHSFADNKIFVKKKK